MKARPISSGRLVDLMFELKNELGVRRPVEIRATADDITPLTVGIFSPVILVPEQIHRWPDEICKTVLMQLHSIAVQAVVLLISLQDQLLRLYLVTVCLRMQSVMIPMILMSRE